ETRLATMRNEWNSSRSGGRYRHHTRLQGLFLGLEIIGVHDVGHEVVFAVEVVLVFLVVVVIFIIVVVDHAVFLVFAIIVVGLPLLGLVAALLGPRLLLLVIVFNSITLRVRLHPERCAAGERETSAAHDTTHRVRRAVRCRR